MAAEYCDERRRVCCEPVGPNVSGRGLLSEIARPNFLHVAFGLGLSSSSCVAIRYVCEYN